MRTKGANCVSASINVNQTVNRLWCDRKHRHTHTHTHGSLPFQSEWAIYSSAFLTKSSWRSFCAICVLLTRTGVVVLWITPCVTNVPHTHQQLALLAKMISLVYEICLQTKLPAAKRCTKPQKSFARKALESFSAALPRFRLECSKPSWGKGLVLFFARPSLPKERSSVFARWGENWLTFWMRGKGRWREVFG